jgi:hypothetical protein
MCLSNILRAFEHRRECLIELAKRSANSTFNDQDVSVTVSATVSDIAAVPIDATARNLGKHPSKRK